MATAQRLAVLTVLVTLVLIAVGVTVRATGSGLGCPDWPLCHGQVVPPTESHHTLIEFSHRLVASIVGLMVIAVAFLAWRHYRNLPVIAWTALAIVPLVGLQGFLGAITVWRELPPEIVATHLVLAMGILAAMLLVAAGMLLEEGGRTRSSLQRAFRGPVARRSLIAMIWLVAVMWIGAYTAESGGAAACSGWPLCNGAPLPSQDEHEIVHMAHRFLAGSLIFPLAAVALAAWRQTEQATIMRRWAAALLGLFVIQVTLGAFNVWYEFPDTLTVAHTVVATTIWSLLGGGAIIGYYAPAARTVRGTRSLEVPA